MVEAETDRPALTNKVSRCLYPYLRAWTDEASLGDAEFDNCATVEELCDLLASRLIDIPELRR